MGGDEERSGEDKKGDRRCSAVGEARRQRRGVGKEGEVERVVFPLTVTESEPLSCRQEKNTEAHINCTRAPFLFALSFSSSSPPALPSLKFRASRVFPLLHRLKTGPNVATAAATRGQ